MSGVLLKLDEFIQDSKTQLYDGVIRIARSHGIISPLRGKAFAVFEKKGLVYLQCERRKGKCICNVRREGGCVSAM